MYMKRSTFDYMGYAVRSPQWRYIEWRMWDRTALVADWAAPPVAMGLYDHRNDDNAHGAAYFDFPGDYINVAADRTFAAQREQLAAALVGHFADAAPRRT